MSAIGLPQIYATLTPAQFTATAAQTTFTVPGGYTAPYVQVMRNGAMLGSGDFTATNGTTVVLNAACSAGDQVVIWAFGTFNVASPQFSDAGFLIYDNADATKKVAFEVSGITTGTTRTVTAPNADGMLALQGPAFGAVSTSTQNPTSGVATQVVLGTEEYDTHNAFSSSIFTVPAGWGGIYDFFASASCASDTSTTQVVWSLKKNGANVHSENTNGSFGTNYVDGGVKCSLLLAAGDIVAFDAVVTGTGASRYIFSSSGTHTTRLSGHFVRFP